MTTCSNCGRQTRGCDPCLWCGTTTHTCNGPTPFEAYSLVAGELYVPGEADYQAPLDVLASLDDLIVQRAREYANAAHLPWPPLPREDGLIFIASL